MSKLPPEALPLLGELHHHQAELRPPAPRCKAHAASLTFTRWNRSPMLRHKQQEARGDACPVCYLRLPRTSMLCRLLVAMIALLVFVQALSCGMFFCVSLPFSNGPYLDYRELVTDAAVMAAGLVEQSAGAGGLPAAGAAAATAATVAAALNPLSAPKFIPRVIHQTYRSKRLPSAARSMMASWQEQNGDSWQVRFYDDVTCMNFVRREFPEYLEAYLSLPKDVERADFFRYLVVLRLGGVYADVDVECRQPLDRVIKAADTMLAGWEAEVADEAEAQARNLARPRQVLNWWFAAAPSHPVLRQVCDHIARNALNTFSNNTMRDTSERTGLGVWTDAVLRHALAHPAAKADDPWKVRILPRVAFGVHPSSQDGLSANLKEIVAMHHFLGSRSSRMDLSWAAPKPFGRSMIEAVTPLMPWARPLPEQLAAAEPIKPNGVTHFPVSAAFEPPFTIMTDLVGSGDKQAGADVSALLSAWGSWQPALAASRRPSVAEALVGSLGKVWPGGPGVLVDVGAGHGFFSLAAAARGHRVVAFEAAPASLAAMQASIAYNGFAPLITLHNASLGASSGPWCLERRQLAAVTAVLAGNATAPADGSSSSSSATAGGGANAAAPAAALPWDRQPGAGIHVLRGYPHLPDGGADSSAAVCARSHTRLALADVLRNITRLGALRISAHGHEGWVLEGALPLLRGPHQPAVVYLEFAPAAMRASGYADPLAVVRQLVALGYEDVAHAGRVCDQRWLNVTRVLRAQETFTLTAQQALKQPTWCKLRPGDYSMLLEHAAAQGEVPENLLFVLRQAGNKAAASPAVSGAQLVRNTTQLSRLIATSTGNAVAVAVASAAASRDAAAAALSQEQGAVSTAQGAMLNQPAPAPQQLAQQQQLQQRHQQQHKLQSLLQQQQPPQLQQEEQRPLPQKVGSTDKTFAQANAWQQDEQGPRMQGGLLQQGTQQQEPQHRRRRHLLGWHRLWPGPGTPS